MVASILPFGSKKYYIKDQNNNWLGVGTRIIEQITDAGTTSVIIKNAPVLVDESKRFEFDVLLKQNYCVFIKVNIDDEMHILCERQEGSYKNLEFYKNRVASNPLGTFVRSCGLGLMTLNNHNWLISEASSFRFVPVNSQQARKCLLRSPTSAEIPFEKDIIPQNPKHINEQQQKVDHL